MNNRFNWEDIFREQVCNAKGKWKDLLNKP